MLHLEKDKGRGRKEREARMLDKRVGFQINAEELNRRGDHSPQEWIFRPDCENYRGTDVS